MFVITIVNKVLFVKKNIGLIPDNFFDPIKINKWMNISYLNLFYFKDILHASHIKITENLI